MGMVRLTLTSLCACSAESLTFLGREHHDGSVGRWGSNFSERTWVGLLQGLHSRREGVGKARPEGVGKASGRRREGDDSGRKYDAKADVKDH